MMKYRLQVTANALNKRRRIPASLPDDSGIVGVVLQGFSFIGERVHPAELNGATERWYRDRDGYYYMGRWLIETEEIPSPEVVKEVKAAPVKAAPPSVLPGWLTSLGIDQLWNKTQGENVKIAVLDSGYNVNNTDLSEGVIDSKVCFTPAAGRKVTINDTFGHGSHCASLIGGRNKMAFTASAPLCDLFIAKICSQGSVSNYSVIITAIQWAIEKKVDIISISYGGESSDAALENIIKSAVHDHNILVIASIGDAFEGSANLPCFPAMFQDCMAVGATDDQGQLAAVTILNNKTEINAPGNDITGYTLSTDLAKLTGTSQAAAIVAGICALIIAHFKKNGKPYTVNQLRNLVAQNSDPVAGHPTQKLISPLKIFQAI